MLRIGLFCCFVFITHSQKELQLVPSRITNLSAKLTYDHDIQININNIASKANAAASFFKSTMANQGSQVLAQKSSLMTTLSPNDVRITRMENALTAAIEALTSNKQQVINLQTDIHSNTEQCRSRKTQREAERQDKEFAIDNLHSEITSLETKIAVHEDEASTIENGAVELDRRADEMRRAARRKRKRAGLGAIIGGIFGVVFAPFTGGASLALATAAAGVNAGINLNDAEDCVRYGKRLREEAEGKRTLAQSLRSKKSSLLSQKQTLQSEIKQLEYSTGKLGEAAEVLQEVAYVLQSSIRGIDNVLKVFQEMETVFTDASLQTNSFKIIQSAFDKQPDRLEGPAQKYLNQLKEKWTAVEAVLLQHDASSITY